MPGQKKKTIRPQTHSGSKNLASASSKSILSCAASQRSFKGIKGGFLKMVSFPNKPMGKLLLKNDQHLGCEIGGKTHHWRKHPSRMVHSNETNSSHPPRKPILEGNKIVFQVPSIFRGDVCLFQRRVSLDASGGVILMMMMMMMMMAEGINL